MNLLATFFFLANAIALMALPRRVAILPLLLGACYMTMAQGIDLGVFYFSVQRLLIGMGVIRVLLRGERPVGGFTGLDWLMLGWAVWALLSSLFHQDVSATLVYHLGMVYNTCGIFFLARCFCQSFDEIAGIVKAIAIVLVPVALEMVHEQLTGRNLFAVFGGVFAEVMVRGGRIRAQGPFAHPILAGTVGAVCLPLMAGIWRRHPRVAKMGAAACVLMVLASASSGPLLSMMFGLMALALWYWRHMTRKMLVSAVLGYVALDIVMKAPAYYLIARVDLTGSSTGWHRARLIETAIQHLNEWWFAGTDYTRHWMPYGVPWSENHADITNYYIAMGVRGGLPLMLLFIAVLWCAFRYVGQALRAHESSSPEVRFFIWALGASLYAHAATCISVAYFDQSAPFLYLDLAIIGALAFAPSLGSRTEEVPEGNWNGEVVDQEQMLRYS